jgi:uncharacterized phage protein (TIGR01671 family)
MRKIEFRAWVGDRMIDNFMYSFTTPEGWQWFHRGYNNGVREIMQFTGLKDKNGKEIYEGDILSYSSFYIGDHQYSKGRDECIFDEGCFMGGNGELNSASIKNKDIEVIGNIYENSDLLND